MFISGFIVAGLDYRYQWLVLPKGGILVATAVFIFAYLLFAEVLRENRYLSRAIEVQENQKVIDTSLYEIVRHPMYTSTILLFLSIPLLLGSFFSFLIFLIYPLIVVVRSRKVRELYFCIFQGSGFQIHPYFLYDFHTQIPSYYPPYITHFSLYFLVLQLHFLSFFPQNSFMFTNSISFGGFTC